VGIFTRFANSFSDKLTAQSCTFFTSLNLGAYIIGINADFNISHSFEGAFFNRTKELSFMYHFGSQREKGLEIPTW
jgi:hypothetical protein